MEQPTGLLIIVISSSMILLNRPLLITQGKRRMGLRQDMWKIQKKLHKWRTYRAWEEHGILRFFFKPPKTVIVWQRIFHWKQERIVTYQFTHCLLLKLNCAKHLNHLWLCLAFFQPQRWAFPFLSVVSWCDRSAARLLLWGSESLTSLCLWTTGSLPFISP